MHISLFDYNLPKELIAQHPLEDRKSARLMVLNREKGGIEEGVFTDILKYMKKGDVLLLNETKVLKARIFGKKEHTGGKVEVFFIRTVDEETFEAFVRPRKRTKPGTRLLFGKAAAVMTEHQKNGRSLLKVENGLKPYELLKLHGEIPLPPYIKRRPSDLDSKLYQTVYAKVPGAVAAPTAGLHFTPELLKSLQNKGVIILTIFLHTGPGTFKPIKTDNIEEHMMEEEYYEVGEKTAKIINERCGRLFAVGTTTVRAVETAAKNGELSPSSGWTDLYIYPPFRFNVVDSMITNFHLPRTSLIIMISAFAGREFILKAYDEAIRRRFRFYSYGDAMLIL